MVFKRHVINFNLVNSTSSWVSTLHPGNVEDSALNKTSGRSWSTNTFLCLVVVSDRWLLGSRGVVYLSRPMSFICKRGQIRGILKFFPSGTPLQYSCLENPMDGGAWWAAVHGVAEGRTQLSDFTFTFHLHALEKEMATHSSVLAWRIPGTGEPDGLPSMGSHRVGHNWSDLAAAATCYDSYDFWITGYQGDYFTQM